MVLPSSWFSYFSPASVISFLDTRGKSRAIELIGRKNGNVWEAICHKSAYISAETSFGLIMNDVEMIDLGVMGNACMALIPPALVVHNGDTLLIERSSDDANSSIASADDEVVALTCTMPSVLERVRVGDPVWIDDGKVGKEVIEKMINI